MKKQFFGYNSEQEARKWFGGLLDMGFKSSKIINCVKDGSKWPQSISYFKTIIYVELPMAIIAYEKD